MFPSQEESQISLAAGACCGLMRMYGSCSWLALAYENLPIPTRQAPMWKNCYVDSFNQWLISSDYNISVAPHQFLSYWYLWRPAFKVQKQTTSLVSYNFSITLETKVS